MAKDYTKAEIERQATAAAALVRELAGDDAELAHDIAEGETGLFEACEVALDEMDHCDVQIEGLGKLIENMQRRLNRFKSRKQTLVGVLDQAFQMAEVSSHQFSRATISTKRVPAKLVVTDESAIPAEFWEPQPPKLNRKAVTDAAKNGPVEGVHMSNGGTTIQIRRT